MIPRQKKVPVQKVFRRERPEAHILGVEVPAGATVVLVRVRPVVETGCLALKLGVETGDFVLLLVRTNAAAASQPGPCAGQPM